MFTDNLSVSLSFSCIGFDVWKLCEGKPVRTIEKVIFFCVHAPQNSFLPHDPRPVVPDLAHGSRKKRIRQTLINSNSRKRILTSFECLDPGSLTLAKPKMYFLHYTVGEESIFPLPVSGYRLGL